MARLRSAVFHADMGSGMLPSQSASEVNLIVVSLVDDSDVCVCVAFCVWGRGVSPVPDPGVASRRRGRTWVPWESAYRACRGHRQAPGRMRAMRTSLLYSDELYTAENGYDDR